MWQGRIKIDKKKQHKKISIIFVLSFFFVADLQLIKVQI